MTDAIVIGSGPNGLVAANVLADHGWDVLVLEAAATWGGAVRTAELTAPGFRNDVFSAFYPLAVGSPAIGALDLERHGLRWARAPLVLANPTPSGPSLLLSTDIDETAASLDAFAPGDGDAWRGFYAEWRRISDPFLGTMLGPFPPVRAAARLAAALGPSGLVPFARTAVLHVRRMAEERFAGEGGALLLAGNALHTDLLPESAASGLFGWILSSLGQQLGWPSPVGGAGALADAMVARLRARGGQVRCGARVTEVVVRGGRAVGVRTADGEEHRARRAVLADVAAPTLYLDLVGPEHLPPAVLDAFTRYERMCSTFKVDWALRAPVPWKDPEVGRAGTVHLADSLDELSTMGAQLATRRIPAAPFLLMGQMTTTDPTRSPAGTESLWAYTHVPQRPVTDAGPDGLTGRWEVTAEAEAFAARMEERIEAHAPGFRDLVIARHLLPPGRMEAMDANLLGGDVNGGTSQIHQQLVFRPVPGLGRPETPVRGLFLASASAHPGGGVHGACGRNAAHAALAHRRARRGVALGAALGAAGAAGRLARR